MYRLNAGEFKHPVEIISTLPALNDDNIPITIDKVVLSTRARIVNVSGKEKILADGINGVNVKRFYIRYKKNLEINNKSKIRYGGHLYNITYVSNIEEADKYLEIVGELVE